MLDGDFNFLIPQPSEIYRFQRKGLLRRSCDPGLVLSFGCGGRPPGGTPKVVASLG
jgi:hypothetical protein